MPMPINKKVWLTQAGLILFSYFWGLLAFTNLLIFETISDDLFSVFVSFSTPSVGAGELTSSGKKKPLRFIGQKKGLAYWFVIFKDFSPLEFLICFISGLIYAFLMRRIQSLGFCILNHAIWNSFTFLLATWLTYINAKKISLFSRGRFSISMP